MSGTQEIVIEFLATETTEENRLTVLMDQCRDLYSTIKRDNYSNRTLPENRFVDMSINKKVHGPENFEKINQWPSKYEIKSSQIISLCLRRALIFRENFGT